MIEKKQVFVATIDTNYEVMAVAYTKKVAVTEACRMAYRYLRDVGALSDQTNTLAKIEEYFGVTVTVLNIGSAGFVGDWEMNE